MPEDTPQKPQAVTLPAAGATVLIPLLGIPLALHALTGAAFGGLTLAAASLIFGPSRKKIFDIPGLLPPKRVEDAEDTEVIVLH